MKTMSARLKPSRSILALVLLMCVASVAHAQSPNTSAIVVLVTDQSGAMVPDAAIVVTNNQTGATRAAVSGADGSAAFPALSLTGTYMVGVSKQGFGSEERNNITLQATETATLKVKLLVGGEKTVTSVFSAPTRSLTFSVAVSVARSVMSLRSSLPKPCFETLTL